MCISSRGINRSYLDLKLNERWKEADLGVELNICSRSLFILAPVSSELLSIFETQSSRLKAFMVVTTINLKLKVNFHHWT